MKKNAILLALILLAASPSAAQQADGTNPANAPMTATLSPLLESEGLFGFYYHSVTQTGNARVWEYNYLESSAGGVLDLESDLLPHRFVLETNVLNKKDYFGTMDYSYSDIMVLNLHTQQVFHNLGRVRFGPDDPVTSSPSFFDENPADEYNVGTQRSRAFIRFKTPDFPFHLYAEAKNLDRHGTIQQRFMRGFIGGLNMVSLSRDIDQEDREIIVGVNSHLGPVEADYQHAEKKFSEVHQKVLVDTYASPAMDVQHNLMPDLKSKSDTLKIHSSYNGGVVVSGTYSAGEKQNQDSGASTNFRNTAADFTLTPMAGALLALKYRHYDISTNNPDTAFLPGPDSTYQVRDAISSSRELLTGTARYRVNTRLTVKGEYVLDIVARDVYHGGSISPLQIAPMPSGSGPVSWDVAQRTLKSTAKIGATYRIMNALSLRADYHVLQVSNPAYAMDPDRVNSARASAAWMPVQRITILASYDGAREKRDNLSAPLAGGSRKADRDQALVSITTLVGNRSSLTASYLQYKLKNKETLTYRDAAGLFLLEESVPYADKAEVVSLLATQALTDNAQLTGEGSRSISQGRFRTSGSVPGTAGMDEFSDLRVVEDIYAAGLEMRFSASMRGELRYQQRHYNDQVDNTQNGRVSTTLASVFVNW